MDSGKMLQGTCLSVFEAKSRDSLKRECVRFTEQLGFATFAAAAVIDHFVGDATAFVSIDNTPAAFRAASNDPALARRDMHTARVASSGARPSTTRWSRP
jgi:hypothetical protein